MTDKKAPRKKTIHVRVIAPKKLISPQNGHANERSSLESRSYNSTHIKPASQHYVTASPSPQPGLTGPTYSVAKAGNRACKAVPNSKVTFVFFREFEKRW